MLRKGRKDCRLRKTHRPGHSVKSLGRMCSVIVRQFSLYPLCHKHTHVYFLNGRKRDISKGERDYRKDSQRLSTETRVRKI